MAIEAAMNSDYLEESIVHSKERRPVTDDERLNRLGKKAVLKRNFGFASIVGFSCAILVTWEGVCLLFQTAYVEGGPAGTFCSYICVFLGALSTCCCLGELVSIAPTSGGQYHWISMLAPKKCQSFLSYITGWLTLTAWQATNASGALYSAQLIQGLAKICNPGYVPHGWHTALIGWAILLYGFLINIAATTALARFEGFVLILHILGFFAVIIPLLYTAPHNSSHDVFGVWLDGGGWNNRPVSFLVGLVGIAFSFSGSDSTVHMAEEVQNAAFLVPWAMITSIVINGLLGLGMLLTILYCMGPPDTAGEVLSTKLGYPIVQILVNATKSIPGTVVMMSIILVISSSATVGMMATTSRLFWSFSRDRGLPFWQQLSRVNDHTSVPVMSVAATSVISALLFLIVIGSSAVFLDVVSITIAALFSSYLLSFVMLLWRRIAGDIHDQDTEDSPGTTEHSVGSLIWGPFRIPHIFGIANNVFAIAYLSIVFTFVFWPAALPVDAASMNFTCVVFGAVIIFSVFWYYVYARRTYVGPIVEVTTDQVHADYSHTLSAWYGR